MFPGSGATVYYNEDGEPLGWDYAAHDEPDYDPYDDVYYVDEDDEEPDAEEDEEDDEERESDGTSLRDEFLSAERLLGPC
jgi:hypothetical protein